MRGTSRGQYGSYDGYYGPIGIGFVIITAPDAYAYAGVGCEPGTWYLGGNGRRHLCR